MNGLVGVAVESRQVGAIRRVATGVAGSDRIDGLVRISRVARLGIRDGKNDK